VRSGGDESAAIDRNLIPQDAHEQADDENTRTGLQAVLRGDWDLAIARFTAAIQHDPGNDIAYSYRGFAHAGRAATIARDDEWDLAIADFTEAIRLHPQGAGVYQGRGCAQWSRGRWDKALDDFNEAIRLDPKCAEAYVSRGRTYWAMQTKQTESRNRKLAMQDYTEAIRIDPQCGNAYYRRALAVCTHTLLHEEEISPAERYIAWKSAVDDLTKCVLFKPLNGDMAMVYAYRGLAHAGLFELDRAIDDCTEAILINPKCADAYAFRGIVYRKKGENDKADEDCDQSFRLGYLREVPPTLKGQ